MLARLCFVSAVAHASDDRTRHFRRYAYDYDHGFVLVYDYDLPGPGVAGGLLRVGIGVDPVGRALRRVRNAREGLEEDEPMPLCDKLVAGVDVVVGACGVVVGVSDPVDYARTGLARIRGKASGGGCGANSKPYSYLLEDGSTASSGVNKVETGSATSYLPS